jgi:hypothetical protein
MRDDHSYLDSEHSMILTRKETSIAIRPIVATAQKMAQLCVPITLSPCLHGSERCEAVGSILNVEECFNSECRV